MSGIKLPFNKATTDHDTLFSLLLQRTHGGKADQFKSVSVEVPRHWQTVIAFGAVMN